MAVERRSPNPNEPITGAGTVENNDTGTPSQDNVVSLAAPRPDDPFNALIARFGSRVRALVIQHCRSGQGLDADDVEQEVRIRLWKTVQRDRNAVLPASYIQRVVVSTVIDSLRRHQARPMESIEDSGDETSWDLEPEAGPQQLASQRQQLDRLQQGLAALPSRRRQLVQLHLQGFGPSEAGELLGLSADAARKLMERGMKELRERMTNVDSPSHETSSSGSATD